MSVAPQAAIDKFKTYGPEEKSKNQPRSVAGGIAGRN